MPASPIVDKAPELTRSMVGCLPPNTRFRIKPCHPSIATPKAPPKAAPTIAPKIVPTIGINEPTSAPTPAPIPAARSGVANKIAASLVLDLFIKSDARAVNIGKISTVLDLFIKSDARALNIGKISTLSTLFDFKILSNSFKLARLSSFFSNKFN